MVTAAERAPRSFLEARSELFSAALPARRGSCQLGAVATGAAFLVYLLCLPSRIPGGPAGDWVTAATLGGVGPAPGSPAWTLLGWFAEQVAPASTPAARLALLSALCAALAAGALVLWLRQLDVGRRAALAGGLLLAFGWGSWDLAVHPGPASFQLLLTTALAVLVYQSLATQNPRWIPPIAFVAGLGLVEHPAFLLVVVALILLVAFRRPPVQWQLSWIAVTGLAFVLGLLPILYLPWRAAELPYLNCGNPVDVAGVIRHYFSAVTTPESLLMNGVVEGGLLALGALGGLVLLRRHRGEALILIALAAVGLLITGGGDQEVLGEHGFHLVTRIVACAGAAIALDAILQRYGNDGTSRAHTLTATVAVIPLGLLAWHLPANDYSRYPYAEAQAQAILDPLPDDAILLTGDDYRSPAIRYVQGVLQRRPGVILGDPGGFVAWDRLSALSGHPRSGELVAASEIVDYLVSHETRRVYATTPWPLPEGFRWQPWGLVFIVHKVQRIGAVPDYDPLDGMQIEGLPRQVPLLPSDLHRGGAFDEFARRAARDYYQARAARYELKGKPERARSAQRIVDRLDRDD